MMKKTYLIVCLFLSFSISATEPSRTETIAILGLGALRSVFSFLKESSTEKERDIFTLAEKKLPLNDKDFPLSLVPHLDTSLCKSIFETESSEQLESTIKEWGQENDLSFEEAQQAFIKTKGYFAEASITFMAITRKNIKKYSLGEIEAIIHVAKTLREHVLHLSKFEGIGK